MAEEANLPEEIIVYIISRLPVKTLMRFTSVCKRWRSIISFDKDFANELRRNKTLSRRLLACTQPSDYMIGALPKLESLDLETLSTTGKDLGRELNFPFQPTSGYYDKNVLVSLLGSCNGLVILAQKNVFYVFNPLTRFVKKLPRQCFVANAKLYAYGFGYSSASNEYKVVVSYKRACEVISLRDQIWRRIEGPGGSSFDTSSSGIPLNEVLHWLKTSGEHDIVTFDLAREKFSKIRQPDFGQDGKAFSHLGVCFGGYLCVSRYPTFERDSIDFWVMREYQVSESWTKHITLRFTNPQRRWVIWPILVMDNCTVASLVSTGSRRIRFSHKQEEGEAEPSLDIFQSKWYNLIEYEESLVSISQI